MGGITTTLFQRPRDPQFNNTTLLLSGNFPTNGAQNNTFLDSSSNGFTITRNPSTGPNAPTQGTFSPFSQTGWSNFASAASSTVGLSNTTAALIGSTVTTFTAECWIFMTEAPVSGDGVPSLIGMDAQTSSSIFLGFGPNASRNLVLRWFDGASKTATGGTALALNTWYHIAVVSNSNALAMYVNGVAETLSGTTTLTNRSGTTNQFCLFFNSSASNYQFRGYASNIRVTNTAVYTSAFTPSTAPLTAITGTQLLTAQSNRFVDNSTNAYALTVTGSPSVQPFSPFVPSGAYTTTAVGGSGYFDGTGDYLSIADNTALDMEASSFTIETFIYLTSTPAASVAICGKRANTATFGGVNLYFPSNAAPSLLATVNGTTWGVNFSSTINVQINAWNHVAATRNGDTWTIWVNGQSGGTATVSGTVPNNASAFTVAATSADGGQPLSAGYLSNFRVVKGTALYTAAFTPPAAPLTNIANTSLLCNFTNAGIFDSTAKNVLETVGNAQISTTQSKFGGTSMSFDGTGDGIILSSSAAPQNFVFGTGDWTIEFWVYYNSVATASFPIDFRPSGTDGAYPTIVMSLSTTGVLSYYTSTAARINSSALSTGQWYHVAVSRSGTNTRMFINGVQAGSTYTDSANYLCGTNRPIIGISNDQVNYSMNGYIDDLRITKGVARYTANFNVPTIGFTDR